jgi:hypothetical protein
MTDKEQPKQASHLIMQKPLPEIIDDIDISIKRADEAAAEARKAAEEARLAGERAAESVMRRMRKIFMKMSQDIADELKDTNSKI